MMSISKRYITAFIASLTMLSFSVGAQEVQPQVLTFTDNSIQATLELTSDIAVDLKVEFENAVGLHPNTIDISAELLSPTDLSIISRLPTSLVNAHTGFPVVVSIKPRKDKGFAFEGVAVVELYTKALHYTEGTPLRLFRSHANGTFEDITLLTASGSFRARGNTGSFSDFMIMLDTRPKATVIDSKYDQLSDLLLDHRNGIAAPLLADIDLSFSALSMALDSSDYGQASVAVNSLIALVENADGSQVDDVWRSAGDIVNVKGELLTRLYTLRYSLRTL